MALIKAENGYMKKIAVKHHKFVVKANQGDEGAEVRTIQKGENAGMDVWEYCYSGISGMIVGGCFKNLQFGDIMEINIVDGTDEYTLVLNLQSRVAGAMMRLLPNVDVSNQVEMTVFADRKNEKATVLIIRQDGVCLKHYYNREHPNGMPEPEEKSVRGKVKWDYTEQENFLFDSTSNWFAEKFGTETKTDEDPEPNNEVNDVDTDPEDLPF